MRRETYLRPNCSACQATWSSKARRFRPCPAAYQRTRGRPGAAAISRWRPGRPTCVSDGLAREDRGGLRPEREADEAELAAVDVLSSSQQVERAPRIDDQRAKRRRVVRLRDRHRDSAARGQLDRRQQ
jgi:hypothetical protein